MNETSSSYISRRYFKRLLLSFLCISILPLGICVGAILYGNYAMSIEKYTKHTEVISNQYLQKMNEIVVESEKIARSIARNKDMISLLQDNRNEDYEGIIDPIIEALATGRSNRLKIHILDVDSNRFHIGDQINYSFYNTDLFPEWGILYELSHVKGGTTVCANQYVDAFNRTISMSIGEVIRDANHKIIGYVIIDVYRDTLINQLSVAQGEEIQVILLDHKHMTILDMINPEREGKLAIKENKAAKLSFMKAILPGENGRRETVAKDSQNNHFYLYTHLNISDFYESMELLLKISSILLCITVLVCIVAASFVTRTLYSPLRTLLDSMKNITQGNIEQRIIVKQNKNDEMVLLAEVFNKMLDKMNDLLAQVIEETERQKNAEIKSLQAQISPHFLYNMLNEIKALAKLNRTDEISSFVIHLGRLLRRSITYKEDFGTVADEVGFVKDYLALQQIRYERSFHIEMDIPEDIMKCLMPTMILQPVVENSIVHGFTNSRKQHVIKIKGEIIEDDTILFEIYDDGVGVDENYMKYINNVEKSSGMYGGLGLENVQKRILLTYGEEYGVRIESVKDQYTLVRIILPYGKETV